MNQIEVPNLPLTERKADLLWVLYERLNVKETKSEDKLDADSNVNKRNKETTRGLEPYSMAESQQSC
jgi:hypothetical protein